MPISISLTPKQLVEAFRQLSSEQKRDVLLTLAAQAKVRRAARRDHFAERLRELAAARGLEWGRLSDHERVIFVDDLLHEPEAI